MRRRTPEWPLPALSSVAKSIHHGGHSAAFGRNSKFQIQDSRSALFRGGESVPAANVSRNSSATRRGRKQTRRAGRCPAQGREAFGARATGVRPAGERGSALGRAPL